MAEPICDAKVGIFAFSLYFRYYNTFYMATIAAVADGLPPLKLID